MYYCRGDSDSQLGNRSYGITLSLVGADFSFREKWVTSAGANDRGKSQQLRSTHTRENLDACVESNVPDQISTDRDQISISSSRWPLLLNGYPRNLATVGTRVRMSAELHDLGFSLTSCPTVESNYVVVGMPKSSARLVDEGMGPINPLRDKEGNPTEKESGVQNKKGGEKVLTFLLREPG